MSNRQQEFIERLRRGHHRPAREPVRAMARYFINLQLRGDHIPDAEGVELDTLSAAFDVALASAKQMVAVDLMQGLTLTDALNGSVEVQDENGAAVAAFPFREAAEMVQKQRSSFPRC